MRIVLGFVLVSLLGGLVAWLVSGRKSGGSGDLLTPPEPAPRPVAVVPEPSVEAEPDRDADESPQRGFLDSHFGEDEDDEPELAADEVDAGGPESYLVEPGPHAGSARPTPGGGSPAPSYVIKGNAQSMIFHVPGSPSYTRTKAEVWFETEEAAIAAGFRAPKGRAPKKAQ